MQSGFTLVELLVVIVILGILSAVVVFALRGSTERGSDAAQKTDARTIRTAQEAFCASFGRYATSEAELVDPSKADPSFGTKGFLSEESTLHDIEQGGPNDPMCGTIRYKLKPLQSPGTNPATEVVLPPCSDFDEKTGLPLPLPKSAPAGRGQALGGGPRFEANRGQLAPAVRFTSRGPGYSLFLTPGEMVMSVSRPEGDGEDVVRMGLVGANTSPEVVGEVPAGAVSNHVRGPDRGTWVTGAPDYRRVAYREVYPGIDLVWHGDGGGLEYDFVVSPGADPSVITESFSGVSRLAVDAEGALVISTPGGDMAHGRPVVYQDVAGARRPVAGAYRLEKDRVGFDIGDYDRTLPLIVDPVVLSYATYMQGSQGGDSPAHAVATDSDGNTYLTGWTQGSVGFPTQDPYQAVATGGGTTNIFVAKFDADGDLVYSTYLSGTLPTADSGPNGGHAIAADADGNAYVSGWTVDKGFPIGPGESYDASGEGGAFLTKFSPTGQLLSSTMLGGKDGPGTIGTGLSVVGSSVYLSGRSGDRDLPRTSEKPLDEYDFDAFVAKFTSGDNHALQLSRVTRLGGSSFDGAYGVGADAAGNTYIGGRTGSDNFPIIGANFDTLRGATDFFVAKVGPTGETLWSTYVGGTGIEGGEGESADFTSGFKRGQAGGIAIDKAGNTYLTGTTNSNDFPGVGGAPGGSNAVLAKLGPSGNLIRSVYIGGTGEEDGFSVSVDGADNVYVAGRTTSDGGLVSDSPQEEVPQRNQPVPPGADDGFVVKLNRDGLTQWVTYLGGNGTDRVNGVAADPAGNVSVAGDTRSSNFPTKNAFQATRRGGGSGGSGQIIATVAFAARLVNCTRTPAP